MENSTDKKKLKEIPVKLDDLLPRDNVKGGKGKVIFGSTRSADQTRRRRG